MKTLTSSNYHKANIFCWIFAHVSYLTMSTKACSGFFFILFRSWVINKNVNNECVETRSFLIFASNSRSKQNFKKSRTRFCRQMVSRTRGAKIQQKILNSVVVGACQNFQFFRQKTSFLENNRAFSKFLYGVSHT